MAVPVSIEPSRPSPTVSDTIFAAGAMPSISHLLHELWLPDAIDATCVPWLAAEIGNKKKIAFFLRLRSVDGGQNLQHIPTISRTFPSSWTFIEIERNSSMLLMSCVLLYSPKTMAFSKFPWAISMAQRHPFFVWYKMQSYVVLMSEYCFSIDCKHSSPLSRSSFRSLSFSARFWSESRDKKKIMIFRRAENESIYCVLTRRIGRFKFIDASGLFGNGQFLFLVPCLHFWVAHNFLIHFGRIQIMQTLHTDMILISRWFFFNCFR